ncbi:Heavy metal-associated isoprenylated plant protein 7 [Dionaea muscipula]
MGEEEEEKKKGAEEVKKPPEEEAAKAKGEEKPPPVVADQKKTEDAKDSPPEIVLRVYMHCEGCARKVKKSLKGFDGVEDVITDCKTHKVVVKGERADPSKVLQRVQRKISHRHVELLSPIPKPPAAADEPKKTDVDKDPVQADDHKKQEPKVMTVVLKVHMHCEACALEIKKIIERMKEVEAATPDLKNSEVTVKGTFDQPAKLVDYVYKRTGKQAAVVKQDPPPPEAEKKEEEKAKEGGNKEEEKKAENGGGGGGGGGGDDEKKGGGGGEGGDLAVELRTNEYHYYPPKYGPEMYGYFYPYPYPPPQTFSDENPNACSIM